MSHVAQRVDGMIRVLFSAEHFSLYQGCNTTGARCDDTKARAAEGRAHTSRNMEIQHINGQTDLSSLRLPNFMRLIASRILSLLLLFNQSNHSVPSGLLLVPFVCKWYLDLDLGVEEDLCFVSKV